MRASAQPITTIAVWVLVFNLIALVVFVTGAVVYAVVEQVNRTTVESSEVFRLAVAQAQANPQVAQALGQPVVAGPAVQVAVFTNAGDFGQAAFSFELTGSIDAGRVQVVAAKQDGAWVFETLTLNAQRLPAPIDLLASP